MNLLVGDLFPYATLFIAVLITAGYGGFSPALVAVVLGAFSSDYFLLPPRGRFALAASEQQWGMALYLSTSLGIAWLGGTMHAARRRAQVLAGRRQPR